VQRHRSIGLAISGATAALSLSATAAPGFDDEQRALPCRPTIACTAEIVAAGSAEVEIGYLYRRLHPPARQHSLPFLAKLTLADRWQLQIGGNGPTFENAPVATRYVDDIVGGLKVHLRGETPRAPSLAFSSALSVPLASAAGYTRTYDVLTTAYATEDVGWLHADLNLGLDAWRVEGPVEWQPWAALALSVEVRRPMTIMVESYYFADARPIAPRDGGLLGAIAYSPRPWLVFDAGGDVGYFPSERAFSLFLGVTAAPLASRL
jgi:hypothetical protein